MAKSMPPAWIVVVGASAGGVEALSKLAENLPPDIRASVLMILHIGERSFLPQLLARTSAIPVDHARSGEPLEAGRIYVAPPGRHMLVHDSHLLLRRGPRENRARPAIDPLFRSAACSFGSSTIGVILTGSLNDGTAGLDAVRRCGGVTVVQDPQEAAVPDMPASALQHVDVDHCVPLSEIGALLGRLTAASPGPQPDIPELVRMEAAVAAQEHSGMETAERLGTLSPFICPDCNGPLWEMTDSRPLRFRCHTGHAFTAETMLEAQSEEAEGLLWSLLRAHQQRAAMTARLAESAEHPRFSDELRKRAKDYERDAQTVRRMIERIGSPISDANLAERKMP